jgi:hypothetical protein
MPGTTKKFRDVSELRIQYLCEYRLFLRQVKGDVRSTAAETGVVLHRLAEQESVSQNHYSVGLWLRLLLLGVAVGSALLWLWG